MKQKLAFILPAFAVLTHSAQAAVIQMTGWESDVVAEAAATSFGSPATTGGFATVDIVIVQAGYTGTPGAPGPTNGTPLAIGAGNIVTTVSGTQFLVNPTANNTIREEDDNGGTLTLVSPNSFTSLQFLITGIGGNSESVAQDNFTATLNFSDATTAVFRASVRDWQSDVVSYAGNTSDGTLVNAFAGRTTHGRTSTSAFEGGGQFIREFSIDLAPGDQGKTLNSIGIAFKSGSRLGVSGVSGIPEPSTALLGGLGLLALLRRRR